MQTINSLGLGTGAVAGSRGSLGWEKHGRSALKYFTLEQISENAKNKSNARAGKVYIQTKPNIGIDIDPDYGKKKVHPTDCEV